MSSSLKINRFWVLTGLKLNGESSPEELHELEELIEADKDMLYQYQMIENLWHFKSTPKQLPDIDSAFSRHLQRLSNHLSNPALQYESVLVPETKSLNGEKIVSTRGRVRAISFMIASIAAAVAIFIFVQHFFNVNDQSDQKANIVSTRSGSKSKIELPDGTQVWLNAESKLTYRKDFGNKLREVTLSGEAFFDVKRDVDHPFIIHTNSLDLKVLGTAFNVRSYANEKTSEATLIRGSIEVTIRNSPDKKIVLKPSEKIIFQNNVIEDKKLSATQTIASSSIFWVDKVNLKNNDSTLIEATFTKNYFAFDNESLEEIALKIEHWYNVKVNIVDDELRKGAYSGDFKNESLNKVMEALHLTGKFNFSIEKGIVTISK